jgi:hypothetical protein
MAVAFTPGQSIGRNDLDIFLNNAQGNPSNAAEITYALYYVDPGPGPVPTETEVLIGGANRVPINPAVGEYYASLIVPSSATAGTYRIRWTFREFVVAPLQMVVQEFAIIGASQSLSPTSTAAQDMVDKLRTLLRDCHPDRHYHFRPPEAEGRINNYNQIFGQIWEDEELLEYIERALDWWNMFPPMTGKINTIDLLVQSMPMWRTAILWQAIVHACFALQANWVADEFDYNIGGISLSLERSSKYESLRSGAEQQFDKATEAKQRTVKFIRGLQQPRFGIGVRSSFGAPLAKGILGPRAFL